MAPYAFLIATPLDFKRTIDYDDFSETTLVSLRPDYEKQLRHVLADIFNDLPNIELGDPRMVSLYLDGIEEPLETIESLALELLALIQSGSVQLPEGQVIPEWKRVHYLIVSKLGHFRIGPLEGEHLVHRFDPDCDDAMNTLLEAIKAEEPIANWTMTDDVIVDYEGTVPWCPTCRLTEIPE